MGSKTLSEIKEFFKKEDLSLFVLGRQIRCIKGSGITILFNLLHEEECSLVNAFVMDKVVGKAAAALMVIGHVREVNTHIISTPALKLLEDNDVKVSFDEEVENILNRAQDGLCPMELLTQDCSTAEECYQKIEEKLKNAHILNISVETKDTKEK